jgi:hypothetical protein
MARHIGYPPINYGSDDMRLPQPHRELSSSKIDDGWAYPIPTILILFAIVGAIIMVLKVVQNTPNPDQLRVITPEYYVFYKKDGSKLKIYGELVSETLRSKAFRLKESGKILVVNTSTNTITHVWTCEDKINYPKQIDSTRFAEQVNEFQTLFKNWIGNPDIARLGESTLIPVQDPETKSTRILRGDQIVETDRFIVLKTAEDSYILLKRDTIGGILTHSRSYYKIIQKWPNLQSVGYPEGLTPEDRKPYITVFRKWGLVRLATKFDVELK